MKEETKKIEMWDEDRGWVRWCDNCKNLVGDEDKICPHCYYEFLETIRC